MKSSKKVEKFLYSIVLIGITGILCSILITSFSTAVKSGGMSMGEVVLFWGILLFVCFVVLYFILPKWVLSRAFLTRLEITILLAHYVKHAMVDEALGMVELLDRDLNRKEIQTIMTKCTDEKRDDDVKKMDTYICYLDD